MNTTLVARRLVNPNILLATIAAIGLGSAITFNTTLAIGLVFLPLVFLFVASPIGALLTLTVLRTTSDQLFTIDLLPASTAYLNTHMLLVGSFLVAFGLALVAGRLHNADSAVVRYVLLFLFATSFSLFSSLDLLYDMVYLLRICTWLCVLIAATALVRSDSTFQHVTVVAHVAAVAPILVGLYQLLVPHHFPFYANIERSVVGGAGSVHTFASTFLFLLPLLTVHYYSSSGWKRRWSAGIIAIITSLIFFTFVRHAWLGLSTYVLILVCLRSQRRSWALLSAMALIFTILTVVEFESVLTRLHNVLYPDAYLQDWGSGRLRIWRTTLSVYSESTLSQKLFGQGSAGIIQATGGWAGHNDFVDCLFRFGAFGLLAYLLLLVCLGQRLWRTYVANRASHTTSVALAAFAAYIVSAIFNGYLSRITAMVLLAWLVGGTIGVYSHRSPSPRLTSR